MPESKTQQTLIRGVVESFEDLSTTVRRLLVRIDGDHPFDFQAGQYVSLRIPVNGQTVVRAYSIASAPDGSSIVELCFKHIDGGLATEFLYACRPGTPLEMTGPAGRFVLRVPLLRDSAFIATGTGITPIRSMLQALFRAGTERRISLIFGARHQQDILYRREFEALEQEHANFRFIPTLSRPDAGWKGAVGHVQEWVQRYVCKKQGMGAYLCGLDVMVKEVRALLLGCGLDPEHIHYERYEN